MILPTRAREIRGNRRKGKGGVRGSPFGGARDGAVGFAHTRMKNLKMVFRSVKRGKDILSLFRVLVDR